MSHEQIADIRTRMRADYIKVLREHLGRHTFVSGPMLDDLVEVGMFHIEHLLDGYGGDHDGND